MQIFMQYQMLLIFPILDLLYYQLKQLYFLIFCFDYIVISILSHFRNFEDLKIYKTSTCYIKNN